MAPAEFRAPEVSFEDVSVHLGGFSILEHVRATAPAGSCTVIVGPNGAGKTSLLLALLGEIPYTGQIRMVYAEACGAKPGRTGEEPFEAENAGGKRERTKDAFASDSLYAGADAEPKGTNVRHGGLIPCRWRAGRRPRIGYVPQKLNLDRGMPLTVTEFLSLGALRRPLWLGVSSFCRRRARDMLELVHAGHLAEHRVGALSGGEMQRVLLALALDRDPELLVLDEPSAGVDFTGGHLFCEILDNLRHTHGFTQIMVSHDLAMAAHHATRVIGLKRSVVAEGSAEEVLNARVLNALFGIHMGLICDADHQHSAPAVPDKGEPHA